MKQKFNVIGMSCSACSGSVTKAISSLQGVKSVNVNLLANSMDVEYDDKLINNDQIIQAVFDNGYNATLYTTAVVFQKKSNMMKYRLIFSIIFMSILFYLAMGHMVGLPIPDYFHHNLLEFALVQLLLSIPIYLLNYKYFTSGFKALFKKHPNMDSLIAIGALAAFLYGLYAIYKIASGEMQYAMDLYFETGSMILALVTVGKYIETNAKSKTSAAIGKLINLRPNNALVKRGDFERIIPIEDVVIEDLVIVKPGETIPMDGVVIKGETTVDEAMLTGESLPVDKSLDSKVIGATLNLTGYIEIRVTKTIEDSTLNKIVELVENASSSKAPIAKLADKISSIFVPIVLIIALVTFISWLTITKSLEESISFAIAVLVVSCPCALGIATPSAIMVATGISANHGILIKDAASLELANKIKTIVLDKTGTITKGNPEVVDIYQLNHDLPYIAYSLEKLSTHPLALAITNKFSYVPLEFDSFNQLSGRGIIAKKDKDTYYAGNYKLFVENKIDVSRVLDKLNQWQELGHTTLIFAKNKEVLGLISIADQIKQSSIEAIKQLNEMNIKTIMLTGDNQKVATAIANKVGINNFVAEVMPEDKQSQVKQFQGKEIVAMVGDGINDSPALMQADVGIAIGSGSDVALESADIILVKNDLMDIVTLIKLSYRTLNNIKQNLFWAMIYNTVGIPLAAGVLYSNFGLKLNPMFAAFAMSISSITVVLNALRLKRFTTNKKKGTIMKREMIVEGMTCNHCKKRVEDTLNAVDGIIAEVNLQEKKVYLTLSKEISNDVLKNLVTNAGYEVIEIN